MRNELQRRVELLRSEFEKGKARLQELQQQELQLQETMLRISGAIQVLTELLEQEEKSAADESVA